MRIIESIKSHANTLKTEIRTLYYAYRHPDTTLLPKVLIFFTLGYALSPVDLIPDFIPVLGYVDDLVILPALIALSIKLIPKRVLDESREEARRNPVKLKKNWIFAAGFIMIWIILIAGIIFSILPVS